MLNSLYSILYKNCSDRKIVDDLYNHLAKNNKEIIVISLSDMDIFTRNSHMLNSEGNLKLFVDENGNTICASFEENTFSFVALESNYRKQPKLLYTTMQLAKVVNLYDTLLI